MVDVLVVGGGHAGLEAALISAKMGANTVLVSHAREALGRMSCNPAIGGIAKGQLVREVDALGGQMGLAADCTGIHFAMLNTSKGPAVQSPRCQSDKYKYSLYMQEMVSASSLQFIEDEVTALLHNDAGVQGVRLAKNGDIAAKKVIITSGTFMNGMIHRGKERTPAGRIGEAPSLDLPRALRALGLHTGRLKTGTPPRVAADSLDYSKMEIQHPDECPVPFSYRTKSIALPQVPCYIAWTNKVSHQLVLAHKDELPLFNGQIEGIGPRYCPSIEDKVCRFPEKDRQQIFIEPEGLDCGEIYLNGISTSMAADLQDQLLKTIPGLEHARVLKYGYAIEYDYCPPEQIMRTMQCRDIENLYLAGQINGTTGYEEAAGQGLLAGINAVLAIRSQEPLILGRDEAYLGVLADDLVLKDIREPYRMFTSRAEYRLNLRHDNADERLMKKGYDLGLIDEPTYSHCRRKYENVNQCLQHLTERWRDGVRLNKWLQRPGHELSDSEDEQVQSLNDEERKSLAVKLKYHGYLEREQKRVARFRNLEAQKLPGDIDYLQLLEMNREGREKLARFRPESMGQACRIDGVSPADLQIIEVYLKRRHWPLRSSS